ncbi:MAG: hypothetical protein LBT78_11950, partial [Tannerella sp.]|nr:hypothetical protein [Tannerella sp.]
RAIAKKMKALYAQAESAYTLAINSIIQCQSKDLMQIERLLDGMLDFANSESILVLYRKLCCYYYNINPKATASYIQSYKELYDEDEELFKSGYFRNNPIKI